jgi:hypothetical protein
MTTGHSSIKRKSALALGYILAIGLCFGTGYVVGKELNGPFANTTKITLPSNYLDIDGSGQIGNQLVRYTYPTRDGGAVSIPRNDVSHAYTYEGNQYSLDVKFDQEFFPYLDGGSITGRASVLKDGQPIANLPNNLLADYAPNRRGEKVRLNLCVAGIGGYIHSGYLPVQSVYQPAMLSYVYSKNVITDGIQTDQRCNFPIDFENGQAEFQIFYGGMRDRDAVYIDAAISVGEIPNGNWKLALSRNIQNIIFEDRVNPTVSQPSSATLKSSGMSLSFSPGRLQPGVSQSVSVSVNSTNPKVDSAIIFTHLVGNPFGVLGADGVQMGEWQSADSSNSLYSFGPYQGVLVKLTNGRGVANFKYSGRQTVAPYVAFSAMDSALLPPPGDDLRRKAVDRYDSANPYTWYGSPQTKLASFADQRLPTQPPSIVRQSFNWLLWLLVGLSLQLVVGLLWSAWQRRRAHLGAESSN